MMAYRKKDPAAAAGAAAAAAAAARSAAESSAAAAAAAAAAGEEQRSLRAAPSLAALRERIATAASRAGDAARRFRRKHTDKADDDLAEVYDEFVRPVLQRSSASGKDDLKDWRDLNAAVVVKFKDDQNVSKRQDYKSLVAACRRAAALEALLDESRPPLERARAAANKYLVSLAAAIRSGGGGASGAASQRGHRFACVDEYENRLNALRRDADADLESVSRLARELDAVRPISRYLGEYGKVLHYMREIADRLEHCAALLRSWAVADEQFVANGEKELLRAADHAAALRSLSQAGGGSGSRRYDAGHGASRRAGGVRHARLTLLASRQRLAELRLQAAAKAKVPLDGGGGGERLAAAPGCRSAPPDCQHDRDGEVAATAGTASARSVVPAWDSDRRRLADAVSAAEHAVQAAEDELTRRLGSAERFRARLAVANRELVEAAESSRETAARAKALGRLLELKKDPLTLRKIEHSVFNIDGGNTQAAVRRAAAAAGAGWPKLYSQLAFVPPRSDDYLCNDIDVVRRVGERWGQTEKEMADRALNKWLRKSCSASAGELDYVVQRMQRLGDRARPVRVIS